VQPDSQGGTHDAAADQQHVDFLGFCRVRLHDARRDSQTQQGLASFLEH
jgi:hypothetical protein